MSEAVASLAKIIVWERDGRWAIQLRRLLRGDLSPEAGARDAEAFRVYEVRTPQGCRDMLDAAPASFLILELRPDNSATVLQQLTEVIPLYPGVQAVVVGRQELQPLERLAREAGAVNAAWSLHQLQSISRMATKHLARAPQPRHRSFRQQIWARLPWASSRANEMFEPNVRVRR